MARLLSPDDACISVDVPTNRGTARYNGRTIDVTNPVHERALKAVGYTVADTSGAPVRRGGFDCAECGFRGYFRRCSRCGSES
jgi:hypothetical protein